MSLAIINPYEYAAAGGGGPDGTSYYVELTIDHTLVPSTLTDFPVYVDLSTLPAGFFANVESDGRSIRVTDSTGSTQMPRDLVSIDKGGSGGELHFLASQVSSSSDSVYRIYYGNPVATQPLASSTYGRNAVWANNYAVVYHGEDGTDSTGNGNTLTSNNISYATAGNATARMSTSFHLDGSYNAYFYAASDASQIPSGAFTMQAWIYQTGSPGTGNQASIMSKWDISSNRAWYLYTARPGASNYLIGGYSSTGSDYEQKVSASSISLSTWHQVHAVATPSARTIPLYIDGSLDGQTDNSSGTPTSVYNSTAQLRVGSMVGDTRQWQGYLSELRLALSALTADWIGAEHANQSSPGTFYAVGSQQAA